MSITIDGRTYIVTTEQELRHLVAALADEKKRGGRE